MQAVAKIKAEGIADIRCSGKTMKIQASPGNFNVSLDGGFSCDPEKDGGFQRLRQYLLRTRKAKGVTPEKAEAMMKGYQVLRA